MANIGNGRVLRACDICGQVDDHPRLLLAGTAGGETYPRPSEDIINKVIDAAPEAERGRILGALLDTTSMEPHYDCYVASGGDSEVARQVVAAADGKTGKALHTLLTGGKDPIEYRDDLVKGE